MFEIFLIVGMAVIAAVVSWMVLSRKKTAVENVPQYICTHCGEKHCDCHRLADLKEE